MYELLGLLSYPVVDLAELTQVEVQFVWQVLEQEDSQLNWQVPEQLFVQPPEHEPEQLSPQVLLQLFTHVPEQPL